MNRLWLVVFGLMVMGGAAVAQGTDSELPDDYVPVPEPTETAMRYYHSGNILFVVTQIWSIAIPLAILFTGFSAKIRNLAQRIGRKWFFTVALYGMFFSLLIFLLDLPLAYYTGYVREHAYELSNQTFSKWLSDSLISLAVALVVIALILWIPYGLVRVMPKYWWLVTGLLAVPLIVFAIFVMPIWIDPLYNDFQDMTDKELEREILALAERSGIEGSRVFEVDKSKDTESMNAYVTGFGDTQRIVLWDTIIEKLDRSELLFVMAHEMGHYVLGHVVRSIIFASLLILMALYAVHRTAHALIHRFKDRSGFDNLSDVASLPLVLVITNAVLLVLVPVINTYSRHQEHEADRFALELTRSNQAAAGAFVKLQYQNLANPRPGPLFTLYRATHPTLGDRIDFCNTYRPWETGANLRYEYYFR